MAMKRSLIAAFAILACLMFAWATGAGRPYPANAGGVIDPTCTSSSPCIEYDNNGTGPGIRGVSLTGNGSNGITKMNSTSAANGREGVFGNDLSTSGSFNSGVRGLSLRGTGVIGSGAFGVNGIGSQTGVTGSGTYGVVGTASEFVGVFGSGPTGVAGKNTSSATSDALVAFGLGGRLMRAHNSLGVDVFTVSDSGNIGVDSPPDNHTSLIIGFAPTFDYGIQSTGNLVGVVAGGSDEGIRGDALSTTGTAVRADGDGGLVYGGYSPLGQVFTVDNGGNVSIAGKITTAGTCSVGCAKPAAPGYHVVSYAPTESLPTMEDTGEAQLVGGSAYVRIDPAFAKVIDRTANYIVLITPEGPSRGLYVTQKTPAGFSVMENPGGHSTLAFSYRIVAKPYGSTAARLPMVYMPKGQTHRPGGLRPFQV